MQCICIPTDLHLHKPTIETNMNNQVNRKYPIKYTL